MPPSDISIVEVRQGPQGDPATVTAENVELVLNDALAADPEGALSALTPNRILYLADLAASYFNGTHTTLIGVIPLTAAQAVVGTKIRVRGFVRSHFQGISPDAGEDASFYVGFNVAASAAHQFEGFGLFLNLDATNKFEIDAELELKTAPSSKYKVGLGANTPTYVATSLSPTLGFQRYGREADNTIFVVDPTTAESVGSTAGLVVQLQTNGGIIDQSICNFWLDLNYEITTP